MPLALLAACLAGFLVWRTGSVSVAGDGALDLLLGALLPLVPVIGALVVGSRRPNPELHIVNPLFMLSMYWIALFTIEPLFVLFNRRDSVPYVQLLPTSTVGPLALRAGVLVTVAYLALVAGYLAPALLPGRSESKEKTDGDDTHRTVARVQAVPLEAIVLGVMGLVGLVGFRSRIPEFLASPENRSQIGAGTGVLYTLVLGFLALPAVWISASRGHPNWKLLIPASFCGLAALSIFGGRAEIVEALLTSTLVWVIWRRPRRRSALRVMGTTVAVVVMFASLFFVYRLQKQDVNRGNPQAPVSVPQESAFGARHIFAPYDNLLGYLETIGRAPVYRVPELGRDLARSMLPTQVVGEKPREPSQVLYQVLYDQQKRVGVPFTLPGLLHYAGGWPVVLIGTFILGFGMRAAYDWMRARGNSPLVVAVYAYIVTRLGVVMLGVFEAAVIQGLQIELVIFVAIAWATFVRKSITSLSDAPHANPSTDSASPVLPLT